MIDPRTRISKKLFNSVRMVPHPDPENVWRLDRGILPMCCHMERVGMHIDRGRIEALHKHLTLEMERLQAEVERLTGYSTLLSSGDQVADLLFTKLGLKQQGKTRMTKSKARLAADSDVLTAMVSKHESIPVILQWKVAEKLRSTYTTSLLVQLDDNDRVHPNIGHTVAETGRLVCRHPNLTNIPTGNTPRTRMGQEVRKCFTAPKGMVIGSIDLSGIEPRHAAFDSQCPALMDVFTTNSDLYWTVASKVFKREFTAEDRKHGIDQASGLTFKELYRQAAKVVTLGTLYDIGPEGLVDQLISFGAVPFLTGGDRMWDYNKYFRGAVEKAADAIKSFFEGFPEVLVRRREHHRRARRWGMVWDCWGRIRPIPQVRSCHPWIQAEGLRACANLPIQGAAAGVLKLWMARVFERVEEDWGHFGLQCLNLVHDEGIFLSEKAVMDDFLPEAAEILEHLLPPDIYNVPLRTSYNYAASWGEVSK